MLNIEYGVSPSYTYISPNKNMLIYKKTIKNRVFETNDLINTMVKTIVRNFEKGYVKELEYGDLALISIADDNYFSCVFGIIPTCS